MGIRHAFIVPSLLSLMQKLDLEPAKVKQRKLGKDKDARFNASEKDDDKKGNTDSDIGKDHIERLALVKIRRDSRYQGRR